MTESVTAPNHATGSAHEDTPDVANSPSRAASGFLRNLGPRIAAVSPPFATLVAILAVWQVIVKVLDVKPYILPAPTEIAVAIWQERSVLLTNAWSTVQEVLLGFALSIAISIPLAVLIASFRLFERTLLPLLVASQVVPKVALAPLFLVWFGFGLLPKVLMVLLIAFFPIVVNTAVGLRSMEIEKLYLAQSMGAGRIRTLLQFRIPQALPSVFAGLKVAATLAVIGATVAEFVGADSGLGYLIEQAHGNLQTDLMFAAIAYLSALGLLLYLCVEVVERLALPWHVSRRDDFNTGG